jgi:uncharacterized repeat protein (TIGR03803 family)
VFRMTASGKVTTLHSFQQNIDGASPQGDLVNIGGTLYGTATYGGDKSCPAGCGAVFKIATDDAVSTVYSFSDGSDGYRPNGGLIAVDGALYGTTSSGGSSENDGTVFKITTTGSETTLYTFTTGIGDAVRPSAGLLYAGGNFYGVSGSGGQTSHGAIFEVTPDLAETVLYSFTGKKDGGGPATSLIDLNGRFYGTTSYGGSAACTGHSNCGTVFEVTP